MPIVEVTKSNNRELQSLADAIASAKRVVVFTGAGISTNCGIPDFRSEQGLYSLLQAQHEKACPSRAPSRQQTVSIKHLDVSLPTNTKGKDLFDSMIWKDPVTTSVFYRFIASLRRTIHEDVKRTTSTHRFIRTLRDKRKLVRCYTQNIDGLEEREGMSVDLEHGKGSRSRFTRKALETPVGAHRVLNGKNTDAGCEVVQLHGDLKSLRCTNCQQCCQWDEPSHSARFMAGKSPRCASCVATDQLRQDRGKRGTKIGSLRPNVVLYGEEHPLADAVGAISASDLTMSPDLLLILGTSLHVHGLKTLVREFAKAVHSRPSGKGKVVFINLSRPAESVWKDVIDYWVCMDCDEWVAKTKNCRPDIWQVQEELALSVKKSITTGSRPKTAFREDDKENIILDSEASLPSYSHQPQVIVTTPIKPRRPLGEKSRPQAIPFHLPKSKAPSTVIPDSDPQSSLPTPPSTGGSIPGRKRKQAANLHNEALHVTPSKRQRMCVDVWEDS